MIRNIFVISLLTILYVNGIISSEKKYSNYTLYRGIPVTNQHLSFFHNLSSMYDANYWRGPGDHLYRPIEFIIKPEVKQKFLRDAENNGVYLTTITEDIQSAFDLQTVKSYIRRNVESFNWQNFYRLKDIYDWLGDLSKMHPREMQIESIGKTHDRRDILAVRIALSASKMRSKVIVEGGIHAREWISPAFVTYMIRKILNARHSSNPTLRSVAETYEWYFVPVLNPDGYEITFTKDRMWRKNKNGVDLNRNFGIAFGSVGVSHDPHSEIYCGNKAFSEPESLAMANFIRKHSNNLEYYFAFHSYGQYMILPYTHTTKHVANFDEVKQMCDEASQAIYRRYKTIYHTGTAYETVGYVTSGVSGCWTKFNFHVPYVVTFELRDDGRQGFALSPDQILPTCRETLDGVLSLLIPKSKSYKLREELYKDGQERKLSDVFVIVWNLILFIIVRY